MACPHVAGIAALYFEDREMTPKQVVSTMQCSAIPDLLNEVEYNAWSDVQPRFLAQVPLESFNVSDYFDPQGCHNISVPNVSSTNKKLVTL